jgi:putative transposase
MIDRTDDLLISKQAEAVNISRGSIYYLPQPVREIELATMHRLDGLHVEYPFAGSRMLRGLLAAEGYKIGRRPVRTLMRRMGIEALYRRPRTTTPEAQPQDLPLFASGDRNHAAEPSLGDGHHVYFDGAGLVYLAAVLEWLSRRHGGWRSPWRPRSALRHLEMHWPVTASRKSSTRIKAASSPARRAC